MGNWRRLLAAAVLFALPVAAADSPPPPPTQYFNDYAGIVSAGAAQRLEEKLRAFDQQTSSQVLVAIFPELPSASLEDFTIRTAQAWRVGRKELDNGVVLFVFVKDRKVRLEVGYGLEGALPDITAHRIIDERITPAFRDSRYDAGLEAGVDAIIAATRGEYTAPPPQRESEHGWLILAIPLGFILLNWWLFSRGAKGRYVTYLPTGRRRGGSGFWYGGGGGGGWSGGGGWGGGGGGGGFSGGGGSFGGGGASGSW